MPGRTTGWQPSVTAIILQGGSGCPWQRPPLTKADTESSLTQPDQVSEVFQALDPLDDVVVQLQLLQVLKLPEVIYAEDI